MPNFKIQNFSKCPYVITYKAVQQIIQLFPDLDFKIWIDNDAKELGTNVSSAFFYGYRLLTFSFHPQIEINEITDKAVILITAEGDGAKRFEEGVLRSREVAVSDPNIIPISVHGAQGVDLVFFYMNKK
jgi:hypothetical protein